MLSQISKFIAMSLWFNLLMFTPIAAEEVYMFAEEGDDDPYFDDFFCDYPKRFWLTAEYLYWKLKESPEPVPLAATAPVIPTGAPLIGQPGTKVVLGDENIDIDWRSGGRFACGYWFDDDSCLGVEANYFFLSDRYSEQTVASSGEPGSIYLAVPYFDTVTHLQSSSPLATPGTFACTATSKFSNKMQGAELNGVGTIISQCGWKVAGLAGFRYWNFEEQFTFSVNSTDLKIPEEIYIVEDNFQTINNFYGGQVGLLADYNCGCFSFHAKGKLALGAMCEELRIDGEFLCNFFSDLTVTQTFPGGYFALPSMIGHHKNTLFAVIPQADLGLCCKISDSLTLIADYTFLYVNNMLWAGKQLNQKINPTQSVLYEFNAEPTLVGKPRPKVSYRNDNLWAHGVSAGFIYKF